MAGNAFVFLQELFIDLETAFNPHRLMLSRIIDSLLLWYKVRVVDTSHALARLAVQVLLPKIQPRPPSLLTLRAQVHNSSSSQHTLKCTNTAITDQATPTPNIKLGNLLIVSGFQPKFLICVF
jgi:hypothetical protein